MPQMTEDTYFFYQEPEKSSWKIIIPVQKISLKSGKWCKCYEQFSSSLNKQAKVLVPQVFQSSL